MLGYMSVVDIKRIIQHSEILLSTHPALVVIIRGMNTICPDCNQTWPCYNRIRTNTKLIDQRCASGTA